MKFGYFGFEEILYEIPSNLIRVDELVKAAGFSDDMASRIQNGGLRRVPVHDGKNLTLLVQIAVEKIVQTVPDIPKRVAAVLFAHSVPLLAPAHIPFISRCLNNPCFDKIPRIAISGQPCAILHMAVQFAGNWLNEFESEKGILVIGADQAYSPKERLFFGSAMGDVAVTMFIARTSSKNLVLSTVSECEVIATGGESSPAEDIAKFRSLNPLYIRHAIEKCLEEGHIGLDDLAYIVPHTPYTMIWDTISELLRFPRNKILTDYISETGHLNSNDSFVHYKRAVVDGKIKDGDFVLLVNPGFGGTRGCTLIRR